MRNLYYEKIPRVVLFQHIRYDLNVDTLAVNKSLKKKKKYPQSLLNGLLPQFFCKMTTQNPILNN